MGFKIAITGIVIFLFCLLMAPIAATETKSPGMIIFFGIGLLAGLFMIPIGLIIQIWQ